jgi:uncharacterized glyoxalase superfamily protein PhnB
MITHVALVVRDYDGGGGTALLPARATQPRQVEAIGNQAGGRVFLFLATDDLWRDYHRMRQAGVRFVREPVVQPYGTVAVFADLYGNLWDLLQYTPEALARFAPSRAAGS